MFHETDKTTALQHSRRTVMSKLKIRDLSLADFNVYGAFANMINPNCEKIGQEPIEFFRDMLQLDLGLSHAASFSVCRVQSRPTVIDVAEYHTACGEGILPLDGDVLIHVGPATAEDDMPLDRFEVFRVPKGTMVTLRPGVWHHAPFAYKCRCVNTLIVLPERAYANDCDVFELVEDEQIEIEGA